MCRTVDYIYILYFGSHIPIAICFDSQAVLPKWLYPEMFQNAVDWYTHEFHDSMMAHPPAWFQTFIWFEILIQLPFFFVALYAYWKGVSRCQWIRLPIVVYSTHTLTALICIYNHIFFNNFSNEIYPGPSTLTERMMLALFYFPYFIVPLMLFVDSLFSPLYYTLGSQKTKKKA